VTDFFSEVEEEVRRERYQQLWKRHGTSIIAVAFVVVGSVAGWQIWERYSLAQREAASLEFNNATNVAEAGNLSQAETEFVRLAQEAPSGYARLAEFVHVKTLLLQGNREEAIANLRELIADSNPLLSAPARLQLAWVLAETAPREEVEAIIAPLQNDESPWRYAASEIDAYLSYYHGDRADAAAAYQALAVSVGAPEGMQQRAAAIAQFLRANTTMAEGGTAPSETSAPGEMSVPAESLEPATETSDQEANQQ
jgi:hypothetical protein